MYVFTERYFAVVYRTKHGSLSYIVIFYISMRRTFCVYVLGKYVYKYRKMSEKILVQMKKLFFSNTKCFLYFYLQN